MSRKHISRQELAAALMSESLASVVRNGSWEWWAEGPDAFAAAIFDAVPERHRPSAAEWGLRGQVIRNRLGEATDE